jgi:hypothetical protein
MYYLIIEILCLAVCFLCVFWPEPSDGPSTAEIELDQSRRNVGALADELVKLQRENQRLRDLNAAGVCSRCGPPGFCPGEVVWKSPFCGDPMPPSNPFIGFPLC